MQFLADVELICEECKGTRYKPQVLEVRYRGKNIHEVLNLTVKEALQFFANVPKIAEKLRVLEEVGLGLSAAGAVGDDALRRRGAAHEAGGAFAARGARSRAASNLRGRRAAEADIFYIFDEPTTGLHFDDVSKLLSAFRRLIDAGGSILVIEHNLEVIKTADWVIDLGPEGGERGGYMSVRARRKRSPDCRIPTLGQFLARYLNGNGCVRGMGPNKRTAGLPLACSGAAGLGGYAARPDVDRPDGASS